MKPIKVELTMGQVLGLSESYYKPTEKEVLEDYLKAVPLLTINDNNNIESLKEQQEVLERKQEDKDREIEQLRQEQQEIMNNLKLIMPMLHKITQKLRPENTECSKLLSMIEGEGGGIGREEGESSIYI
jgi:predicted  nucleic acid-binding Zn-ribbon protein